MTGDKYAQTAAVEADPAGDAAAKRSEHRVIIEAVAPEIDDGRSRVKRVMGDTLSISADIFTDGHESIGAEVFFGHATDAPTRTAPMSFVENDRWVGAFRVDRPGVWKYGIRAWRDPFASWVADTRKKVAAGQAIELEIQEGLALVEQAANTATHPLLTRLKSVAPGSPAQLDMLLDGDTVELMKRCGPRHDTSIYPVELEVWVDRSTARFSSWYELFPRSQAEELGQHGTFRDVIARLPYVRDLGFDVLYFPPIHPIGRTNRKGRNNALTAGPDDPGSVYAIGSSEGGHDAVHPQLGSLQDFRDLVTEAHALGIEIALDFAVQCSPDHPWIKEHPDWFEWRPDGTIKFAENPPKKYEDIVNLRLDRPDVQQELLRVVLFWAEQGVRILRVDNPHTKPIPFWAWLIAEVNRVFPDVIFLAEAFTRPKMMRKLAKIGFQQSYTYFTWRNTKYELTTYVTELMGEMGEYYRPNFFVNTPDINPYFLQTSGRPGFIIRATLAATLSSNWGLYSGFEFCEAAPLAGREEYLDSEKYELKHRDLNAAGHIKDHVRALNRIRRDHPALQDFRNTLFLNAWNDNVLAYAKIDRSTDQCVFVLVNLDPHNAQSCSYEIPLWEFGLPDWESLETVDLLNGNTFTLTGKTHQITLDPHRNPVVIWRLASSSRMRAHP